MARTRQDWQRWFWLVFIGGCVITGWGLGILAAYVTVAVHVISPDNVPACAGMRFGGIALGSLPGYVIGLRPD